MSTSTAETYAALLAAIEAAPHDEAARMVYADWLLERGASRGELVRVQLARRRDRAWADRRLARREARLTDRLRHHDRDVTRLHDRGEQGLAFDLRRYEELAREEVRWARPEWPDDVNDEAFALGSCMSLLQRLRDAPAFAQVYRLDLSGLPDDAPWELLLTSRARPRHVVFPRRGGGWRLGELLASPLLSAAEHLELRGTCDDAALARLLDAPCAASVTTVVCGGARPPSDSWRSAAGLLDETELGPVTDEGFACLGRLPRITRIDARLNAIGAAGVGALAAARPALVELKLSVDGLGTDGLAAVEQAPFANVTRVSIAGPWVSGPDAIVALTRSRCWDGALDLASIPRDHAYGGIARDSLAALAHEPTGRLVAARTGYIVDALAAFASTPFARTLKHLDTVRPAPVAASAMRLETLRLAYCDAPTLRALLASPVLRDLRGLWITDVDPSMIHTLATSSVCPSDLALWGAGTTRATSMLVRSPVMERVTELTLALAGNHASKTLVAACLDTPYLQDVQHVELDFARKFPPGRQGQLRQRFGAALDCTDW